MDRITQVLDAIDRGQSDLTEDLLREVYDELCHLATKNLGLHDPRQTLQARAIAELQQVDTENAKLPSRQPSPGSGGVNRVEILSDSEQTLRSQWTLAKARLSERTQPPR